MMKVTSKWKPTSSYFDLDGIRDRAQNREAFQAFIKSFGWKEYMFHPVVMDFKKLLAGAADYNAPKRDAIGFARLPDTSFESLGGHSRVFRKGDSVMLVSMFRKPDIGAIEKWCSDHDCMYVICDAMKAFHHNGRDTLVFFMTPQVYDQYKGIIKGYELTDESAVD